MKRYSLKMGPIDPLGGQSVFSISRGMIGLLRFTDKLTCDKSILFEDSTRVKLQIHVGSVKKRTDNPFPNNYLLISKRQHRIYHLQISKPRHEVTF